MRVVVGWVGFGGRCWRMMTARARGRRRAPPPILRPRMPPQDTCVVAPSHCAVASLLADGLLRGRLSRVHNRSVGQHPAFMQDRQPSQEALRGKRTSTRLRGDGGLGCIAVGDTTRRAFPSVLRPVLVVWHGGHCAAKPACRSRSPVVLRIVNWAQRALCRSTIMCKLSWRPLHTAWSEQLCDWGDMVAALCSRSSCGWSSNPRIDRNTRFFPQSLAPPFILLPHHQHFYQSTTGLASTSLPDPAGPWRSARAAS